MELIKSNKEKHRAVYKMADGLIRKYWYLRTFSWLQKHVNTLNQVIPGYVVNYGENELGVWLDTKCLPGIRADKFEHTTEFMIKIYDFCLSNLEETYPYAHGDWVLSNIFIDGDNIYLCDWDNIGIYQEDEVKEKMIKDLVSAFGGNFLEAIKNDTASI